MDRWPAGRGGSRRLRSRAAPHRQPALDPTQRGNEPHTASLAVPENERIVGSSARNLRRLARDQELVSAVNLGEFY
jgi:hypothetical protein